MAHRLRLFSPPPCEPHLRREERRATGVYYTPREIVRLILDLTLDPSLAGQPPRILDPACGAGEFLIEAYRRLHASHGAKAARSSLVGMDIDRSAVAIARRRLKDIDRDFAAQNIRTGDSLAAGSLSAASFDLVVGNPPYVNIRQLAKTHSRDDIDALRRRFRTARGNFDLYVLFIERAIELLRPGGRCALVVPNKWATLDYARACRELLLEQTTIEHIIDFSDARAFDEASVYPHVLVFKKASAYPGHAIHLRDFKQTHPQSIEQHRLSSAAIHLASSLDVESRVPTLPLGEAAALSCGTAGYTAQKIARRLTDGTNAEVADSTDFITSGSIDRYAIRFGRVRYLNHDYNWPRLPLDIPELSPAKRRLFKEPKIVIAGMSRRLEAAWDHRGLALGVQVFAASQFKIDPYYLLALLNSKLLSFLFATRFAAKRLGGGYLAINKGQLARLPIAEARNRTDESAGDQLSKLAKRLVGWDQRRVPRLKRGRLVPAHQRRGGPAAASAALSHPTATSIDAEIDQLVYQLYRLSDGEIARIEDHFAERRAAA
jgi:SAM-dependent methyltransferase